MSTITIRLPADLKERVAIAARRAGTTSHGFMLKAIAEKAERVEQRADFHDEAEKRCAGIAGRVPCYWARRNSGDRSSLSDS